MGKIGEIICTLRENISMRDRAFGKAQQHIHGLFAKNFRKIGRIFLMGKIGEIICTLRENISMRDRAFGKAQQLRTKCSLFIS